MTTINVPGKITALEVDESGGFEIVSLTGGSVSTKTTISPSGEPYTIVLTLGDTNTNGNFYFQLDSSFDVGDVVEIYATAASHSFAVFDENNANVFDGGSDANGAGAMRLRKIRTGTTWPTWGLVS
jgi:hypothetical protein